MQLHYFDLEILSLQQDEKVTDNDIKIIQKKSGQKTMKICFPVLSIIILIAIIYSLVFENEFPLFTFYSLFFCVCQCRSVC